MNRFAIVAAAAALALPASAQQPGRATFFLAVGADTLTVERVERTANELRFELHDVRSRTRVEMTARLGAGGLVAGAVQRIFASGRDTVPAMTVTATFVGDSVGLERGGVTNWLRVGRGALPGMNVSAALLEQAIMRARSLGGDSVTFPVLFMPSGPAVPITIVRHRADSARVVIAGVQMFAAVSPDGHLMGAVIPSQNARYLRGPAEAGPILGQKTFGAPPGAPYTAEEVSIRSPAGITLRGTLTMPLRSVGARVPAVVTITGSGPQDRDASIVGIPGYRLYYQLADTLGRRGIAVLRLDDRGAGSDVGLPSVTTADFADDIRAGVAFLRSRPDIDGERIALVGHSEGGSIAPMVAAGDTAIAAIAILGGTVATGREILAFQQRFMVDSIARFRGQQREAALAQYARNTDSLAALMPWMKFFVEYDGRPTAARVRAPVLILHGESDYQVPVAEAERTAAAVRSGGNRDVTVHVFPGLNHLFLPHGGVGYSYEKLPSFVVPAVVMGALADWLAARIAR